MTNNVYYMLVGVPASGKSTYRKQLEETYKQTQRPYVVCSSDDYIDGEAAKEGKTYSEVFQKYAKPAQSYMEGQRTAAIITGIDIIHDQTNLTPKKRMEWLSKIPKDWTKIAIVFTTPEHEDWHNRLASRPGKTIPEHVLNNMVESFVVPHENEGFDSVLYVDQL